MITLLNRKTVLIDISLTECRRIENILKDAKIAYKINTKNFVNSDRNFEVRMGYNYTLPYKSNEKNGGNFIYYVYVSLMDYKRAKAIINSKHS